MDEEDEGSYYQASSRTSSAYLNLSGNSRQDKAFDACCRNCFKAGRRKDYMEERLHICHDIMSSDESVKPANVVFERTKEAWRTSHESAWLLIHLGNLCDIWGVVIAWWCNSHADNVKLSSAVDEEGEYWNAITGAATHKLPEYDRVTRIDFARIATTQIRIDMRGGHPDFRFKRDFFGIRRIEVIGCRVHIFRYEFAKTERELLEDGRRKLERGAFEGFAAAENKKLYMPGEALQEAKNICREGGMPSWSLVMESGILDQYQVWPGTKDRIRMQVQAKYRWTEQDPSHPFYWMSPRERRKMHHVQQQSVVDDRSRVQEEDEESIFEEWGNDSRAGWSRPSSAMPLKSSFSQASTRPNTADTSRVGTRPSTPGTYASQGSVLQSRPSTAGNKPPSSIYASRFGGVRPSTAGSKRPGTAPRERRGVRWE